MPVNSASRAHCGEFVDKPHPVVIELTQDITCEQARELGKILGAHGFTGTFVGGDIASLCKLGAKYKLQMAKEKQMEKQGK